LFQPIDRACHERVRRAVEKRSYEVVSEPIGA
jgi:hypothetical protein